MADLLAVVQSGRAHLRPVESREVRAREPSAPDSIAAVLLKRFEAIHGTGRYEELGGEDWQDDEQEAEWGDDDAW